MRRNGAGERDTRQAIIDAAAQHFSERGFRGTALAVIAETVGVTQANILYHFGSKENLLLAVLDEKNAHDAEMGAHVLAEPGVEVLRRIPEIARADRDLAGMSSLFSSLFVECLDRDSVLHDRMVARYRAARAALADALRAGQRRGELQRTMDADLKAVEILAVLDGIRNQWLLDRTGVDPVAVADQYIDDQLAALATPRRKR